MLQNRITQLFGIKYPIVQGGMRWVARPELVAAVGNAGGIGFLSAHTSPTGDALRQQIDKVRTLTDKPFGINLTLLPHALDLDYDGYVRAIVDSQVKFVETSGNNPARYIDQLKSAGVAVIHKCVTVRHALKAESLGADAVCIDGFECAGHPGEEDVPSLVLIPAAVRQLKIPVLAAGGFHDGRGLITALALGAEGIKMGTRFLMTQESPVPEGIKQSFLQASERDTLLVGRSQGDSIRVWRNSISEQAVALEKQGSPTFAELQALTGAKRGMTAMDNDDINGGALPIGMVIGLIDDLPTCAQLIERIVHQAREIIGSRLPSLLAMD